MSKSIRSSKLLRFAVAAAAVGSAAASFAPTATPASADPKQFSALIGTGSDTTQDIMNAYAGFTNGQNFDALTTSETTGYRQLISFDATGTPCITVRPGAPLTYRPNGSSEGRRFLSRSVDGSTYGVAGCGGLKDVSGLADYARSSSGPSGSGSALTYIPFARDGVSFAYYRANGNPVTNLTAAELSSLFTTGPQTINGVKIIPCGIQSGSGTGSFWLSAIGAGTNDSGTAYCNNLLGVPDGSGRVQENNGSQLKTKGDLADAAEDGVQVVVGFSGAAYISRANGVAPGGVPAGVGLGSVGGVSAVTGTAPNLAPGASFYASPAFGRDVYNVVSTAVIEDFGGDDVKQMFVGANSVVCTQGATTLSQFGFLNVSNCGSTALTGPFVSGTK